MSVQYFRRFKVWDWEVDLSNKDRRTKGSSHFSNNERPISVERLVNECEPETDRVDARLLYEIIGKRQSEADYRDDSSFERDELVDRLEESDEIENMFR